MSESISARASSNVMPLAYRVSQAARLIAVSERTVWRLVASGELPGRHVGRSTVILREDLEAWMRSRPLVVRRRD
jgi:excisionase family DNA binding protein